MYTTSELLTRVDTQGLTEASLRLNYGLRATHWFGPARRKNFYYHEGIDGGYRATHRKYLLESYPDEMGAIWHVDADTDSQPDTN